MSISFAFSQTMDKATENILRKVIREETVSIEVLEAKIAIIVKKELDKKFPSSLNTSGATPSTSNPIIPSGPVSSLLKIISPANGYIAKGGEVITVKIDNTQLPKIREYKVFVNGFLRDTDTAPEPYTPHIFPASAGITTIRVDAQATTGVVYSTSINISVK